MTEPSSKIIMYCHIGKVGGKRLQFYLRSQLGISYRGVAAAKELFYSREELEGDLRWNPYIKYVGGHSVRPHVDYGPIDNRLEWFSFFRDPISRILSHYYQQSSSQRFRADGLMAWFARHPNRAHWQIYMIAGENNLSKAKDIIRNKYSFVGLNKQYEQSLFLLGQKFGLKNFQFLDGSSLPKPEASAEYEKILEDFQQHRDDILELLRDEMEFYDFVANIFNEQCDQYGRENLSRDLNKHFENTRPPNPYNFNNFVANTCDQLFWRPKAKLKRIIQKVS